MSFKAKRRKKGEKGEKGEGVRRRKKIGKSTRGK